MGWMMPKSHPPHTILAHDGWRTHKTPNVYEDTSWLLPMDWDRMRPKYWYSHIIPYLPWAMDGNGTPWMRNERDGWIRSSSNMDETRWHMAHRRNEQLAKQTWDAPHHVSIISSKPWWSWLCRLAPSLLPVRYPPIFTKLNLCGISKSTMKRWHNFGRENEPPPLI